MQSHAPTPTGKPLSTEEILEENDKEIATFALVTNMMSNVLKSSLITRDSAISALVLQQQIMKLRQSVIDLSAKAGREEATRQFQTFSDGYYEEIHERIRDQRASIDRFLNMLVSNEEEG